MDKKPERLVPEVRFKGFTDDWEQRKFDDVVKRINDKDDNPELPHIEFENIISGNGTLNKNIKNLNSKKIGTKFQKEDILFGKLRPYLKNWYFAKENGIAVGDFWVLRAKKISVFVYYLIQTEKFYSIANLSSGSKMPRSDWNLVSNSRFNFPENTIESIKIGNLILQFDKLITLQQRKLEQLKQLKKAMLQQLFVSKNSKQPVLRFKNFDSDWRQYSLKDISAKTYSGLSGKSKDDFGHGKARYITYLNVHNNEVAVSDGVEQIEVDSKQNKVLKGDLLFTISSEVPSEVALNSVWPFEAGKDIYLNSFCFGIRPKSNYINSFFLTYCLRSPQMRKLIYPLAQGISRFNISKQSILALKINIPVLPEQINIYKVLMHIDNLITLRQNKLTQLTTLKKYLLQNLFI